MSDRCPKCAALVKPGADWCTLCYANLRPQLEPEPAPQPEPQSAPQPEPQSEHGLESESELAPRGGRRGAGGRHGAGRHAAGSRGAAPAVDPLTAPLSVLERLTDDAHGSSSAADGTETATTLAGWPCGRCGAVVDFELTACNVCGAGFLTPGSRTASHRSALDNIATRAGDKRFRLAIMALGGTGLLAVIFGLMVLVGSLL